MIGVDRAAGGRYHSDRFVQIAIVDVFYPQYRAAVRRQPLTKPSDPVNRG
jgi:hypothetical protein